MQQHFVEEIYAQPDALNALLAYYENHKIPSLVMHNDENRVLLTGMGASYHAALIASYQLQREQIDAQAIEAIDLLNYPNVPFAHCKTLVYISQSGASGEVDPVFYRLSDGIKTIGITNHTESKLFHYSDVALPLCAGEEFTVATKTYVNSLALLALLAGISPQALHEISLRIRQLLDESSETCALWLASLSSLKSLYFVGHGPHAITARQCAMMVGEWAKRPAVYASIGAFRHGFLEAVGPETGIVIFAPAGVSQQSAYELADELTSYGARVLLVENGHTRQPGDPSVVSILDDELLSPMVDIIPVQLFVEAFARELGVGTGFRYISKVVKQL